MPAPRVLIIEDDAAIRRGLADVLRFAGYEVLEAGNGRDGLDRATRGAFELLLLDLVLPGPSGLEILQAVREQRPTLPAIILTARGEEADRVQGLRLGADDYVVKPFSVRELLARIEAVLRRSPERPHAVRDLPLPEGVADLGRGEARFEDGSRVALSVREVELLRYLAAHPGRAISREEILRRVWRLDPQRLETRTIDMHVANLREKLRDHAGAPQVVITVRGRGYMIGRPR